MKNLYEKINKIGFGNKETIVSELIFNEFIECMNPERIDCSMNSYFILKNDICAYRIHGFVSDRYFIPKFKELMQKSTEKNKKWLEERNIPFKIISQTELGFDGIGVDLDDLIIGKNQLAFLDEIKKWPYGIL